LFAQNETCVSIPRLSADFRQACLNLPREVLVSMLQSILRITQR
jgi:hypothetical protein